MNPTPTVDGVPRLSLAAARRIALAAQGFGGDPPEPWTVTTRHLGWVARTLGVVQVDSVNVLTRSHYLPFFSRLGPYDRELLDRMRDRAPRKLVEYWAHEASLIPPDTRPLLSFRMERAHREAWGHIRRLASGQPELVESVYDTIAEHGPVTARECESLLEREDTRQRHHWGWNWSEVKTAVEYLFWSGRIGSTGRTPQFERRYALPERVSPPRVSVDTETAHLELMRIAARAHGIGTKRCLRDYFRLRSDEAGPAIDRLVADRELEVVEVDGWAGPVYLHATARRPPRIHVETLVSPFDSLVWQRERTEALFGMRFRLEIYTPVERRLHGYYVLPFVYGDSLVARADLKADRARGALEVRQLTWEPDAPRGAGAALMRNLRSMADWLELDELVGVGLT